MGALSLSKTNRLFWMGRYSERVFTTLQYMIESYDKMLDGGQVDYVGYCKRVGIPNIYDNLEHFCSCYLFDSTNPDSVMSSMLRMYDNAVVLRDTIGTQTLSYVELALSAMKKAQVSSAPMVGTQWVLDDILAFRGACDDFMHDEASLSIIRSGNSIERLDLYLRLDYNLDRIKTEFRQLITRLYKTKMRWDEQKLSWLTDIVLQDQIANTDVYDLIACVDGLFIVE